jgi:2-phospho-L-lactate guanylyltransferase
LKATAVLPVKRFSAAKRRLSPGLDDERRTALVAAMLEDVLESVAGSRSIERTIVVSGERRAQEAAAAAGAEALSDPADSGHSEAALAGIARAEQLGAECVVLVPGDCPMLAPRELDRLLTGHPAGFVTIVPDRHGTGTNALVLSPPSAITPSFGEGSCDRHRDAARRAAIPHEVEDVPGLSLDLDTPADVVALTLALERDRGRARRTAAVLGI